MLHLPIGVLALLAAVSMVASCTAMSDRGGGGSPPVAAAGTLRLDFVPVARAGEPGTPFPVGGGAAAAFADAVAKLQSAGMELTRQDRASGTIAGRSRSNALIDCGAGVITGGPEEERFAASSELAVVPAPGSTGEEFNLRELTSETEFRVTLAPGGSGTVASVSESHRVELAVRSLDGSRLIGSSRLDFEGSEIGRFRDGMTCTSSGEIRRLLQ